MISAPGKAFICGEFVALDGAPAVVAAVDRRVVVTCRSSQRPHWHVASNRPGEARTVSLTTLLAADPVGNVLASIAQALAGHGVSLPTGLSLAIDSSALSTPQGRPLGLGSSAAVTVALVAALTDLSSGADMALQAHRALQGGLGSGYDVLCSQHGGVITVRRDGQRNDITPVTPTGGLGIALIIGQTAPSTPSVIRALSAAGTEAQPILAEMALVSRAFAEGVSTAAPRLLIDQLTTFARLEAVLGDCIGAPIVPPGVRALGTELARLGAACKPSGAGGDGLIVALYHQPDESSVRAAVAEHGYAWLEAQIGAPGVRRDPAAPL